MISSPPSGFSLHGEDAKGTPRDVERQDSDRLDPGNFPPDKYWSPSIGLSTIEANRRVVWLLQEAISRYKIHLGYWNTTKSCLTIDILIGVLVLVLFILGAEPNLGVWHVVRPVLLLPWLVLNCYSKITVMRIKSSRACERVRDVLESFSRELKTGGHTEVEQRRFSFDPPNSLLIPVYRDREWKRLPANVLLAGDVFKLQIGDYFPCNCRIILSCDREGKVQLDANLFNAGSVFKSSHLPSINTNDGGEWTDASFVAVTDSFVQSLETFLSADQGPQSRFMFFNERDWENCQKGPNTPPPTTCVWNFSDYTHFSKYGVDWIQLGIAFFISSIVTVLQIIWSGFQGWRRHVNVFATCIICLCHPAFDPFLNLADIWGNVKLQSLFQWHNEKRFTVDILPQQSSSSSSTFDSGSSEDSVDSEMAASRIPLLHQLRELNRVFKRGLDSEGSLLRTLCSVTLLCFVDDMGLLTEGCATPQELAVVDPSGGIGTQRRQQKESTAMFQSGNIDAIETINSTATSHKDSIGQTEQSDKGTIKAGPREGKQVVRKDPQGGERLVILDVFEDSSQYYKQYVKFNNDAERNCIPQVLSLSFAMSATQFPRVQPSLLQLKAAPDLIHTYMGMLANGTLHDFTHCLCAFAGSVGLKRSYIRRFRLLRFIVVLDETLGTNGKMLIYFLRDPRKQIVQMLVKAKPETVFDRSINYHDRARGAILPVSRLTKRKLRDLNMQWVSSGLTPFAFIYKPIHLDEFNLIMAHLPGVAVFKVGHFLKLDRHQSVKYQESTTCQQDPQADYFGEGGKSDAKARRWYARLTDYDAISMRYGSMHTDLRQRILTNSIGGLVNSCLKNSILLGMCATKYQYPKEVPSRIQSFHEAGIRFVYFSKHDEKQTRIVGGLLGLETSWNSMISLVKSGRYSHVNQDGRVVLPSGIDNIRRHIRDVDDIPLQVSLFCDCTHTSTVEMMRILRENGERIMCVGNGLRPSNFFVFCEAHSSVSVALGYHPTCRFCRGKRWSGIARAHAFEEATPEMKLSAFLTSLPCDLQTSKMYKVADPYFVMEMLHEVFKEARHMATNIQDAAAFFKLASHSVAWMLMFQASLGFRRILMPADLALLIFVYIPLMGSCLLSNVVAEGTMQQMPSRCTKDDAKVTIAAMCKTYPRLLLVATSLLVFYSFVLGQIQALLKIELERLYNFTLDDTQCSRFWRVASYSCLQEHEQSIALLRTQVQSVIFRENTAAHLAEQTASFAMAFLYSVSSASWIVRTGRIGAIASELLHSRWIISSAAILTIQGTILVARILAQPVPLASLNAIMPWGLVCGMLLGLSLAILAVDHLHKFYAARQHEMDQKFLRLLFTTRLGMWSPK
ncbi:bifunctional HAD superfamily/P-type ATPase [Babesia duncani]|uniref:Bifunctional HAD superfamily/P-type ATPase n=1 Tax=Babesia duncani TaxID=323732 RepID=A0AAD9PLE9_9APIC|nr:bifunctional HAD superfamily/P-type ATPase [Babesia duncani]